MLDYEDREYIGLAVKVQWKTGIVRWYPAQNLIMGAFRSQTGNNRRPAEGVLTLEEDIFEPGDKVRIRSPVDVPVDNLTALQQVQPNEIGIISGLAILTRDISNLSRMFFILQIWIFLVEVVWFTFRVTKDGEVL